LKAGPCYGPPFNPLDIWTFPEGRFVRTIKYGPLAVSADWSLLAARDGVVDMNSGKRVVNLGRRFGHIALAAFSADGRYLAFTRCSAANGCGAHKEKGVRQIVVIRTADGAVITQLSTRYTSALAVHPDGRTLASGHWDNITLWDMLSGERLALLRGFGGYVTGIAFSKDGSLIVGNGASLQIWDVARQARLRVVNGGGDSIPAFSPDGKLVASGSYGGGSVSLVEVATGKVLETKKISMFGCGSTAFSPDGLFLITPSNGGQLSGWPESGPMRFDTGGTIRAFEVMAHPGSGSGVDDDLGQ